MSAKIRPAIKLVWIGGNYFVNTSRINWIKTCNIYNRRIEIKFENDPKTGIFWFDNSINVDCALKRIQDAVDKEDK